MRETFARPVTQFVTELDTIRKLVNVTFRMIQSPTRSIYMPTRIMTYFLERFDERMNEIRNNYPVSISHELSAKIHANDSH